MRLYGRGAPERTFDRPVARAKERRSAGPEFDSWHATAGTYAQLVEAAESCQGSVIHPGKPRNPQEPELEELLKRAAPFL